MGGFRREGGGRYMNPAHVDAGMFHHRPGLRKLCQDYPLDALPRPGALPGLGGVRFTDQTELMQFIQNIGADPGVAQTFEPLPVEPEEFVLATVEAVQLSSGDWYAFEAISGAFYKGALPEAATNEEASILQASCKPREPSQWWLFSDKDLAEQLQEEGIPMVRSADGLSHWVATFDETPSDSFWDTSVGQCYRLISIFPEETTTGE